MAFSYHNYTGDNSTTTFNIPFTYTATSEISVTVDGVAETGLTFPSSTEVTLTSAPTSGTLVQVRRTTVLTSRTVDFVSGSVLTEEDLDNSNIQVYHAVQEAVDKSNDAIALDLDDKWDANNKVIKNVADPVNNKDAVNKQFISTNLPNITTVAGIASDVTTVAGISTDVTAVAADATDIGTVSTNIASVNTVATNIADVVTVANDLNEAISEIETAANDLNEAVSEIDTVGQNIANVNTVGTNIANVTTVAGIDSNVTTVAGVSANVTTVAGISGNVTTVAGVSANVTTVAGISADVTTVAGDSADIQAVAADATDIGTVATNIANVNAVGGDIANVNTVATNIADVNSFANTYFVSASAPSSPSEGDLWFDTTNDIMKVYDGAGFINAGSSVNGTANRVVYTATAGQTTFNATYDAGYVDVYLNGVKLIVTTDFTATNGSTVVLTTGATLNDTVDIVAYGTFSLGVIDIVNDDSPQLGGNLDLNNFSITGTGSIPAANLTGTLPAIDGSALTGISTDLVGDTTPQLGGDLDLNSNDITGTGAIPAANLTGTLPAIDGSALTGIAAGATGGGSDQIFYENGQTVTTDYTITNGKNAMSAGAISIDTGVTVTVGTGETWTVV